MSTPDVKVQGDRALQGVARGGALNLAGTAFSQIVVLGVTALLARSLGTSGVGAYAQCYAVLQLLSLLALSGFRAGTTRYVAVHVADGDAGAVRGTVRLAVGLVVASSSVLSVALALLAPILADHLQVSAADLRFVALTLPATALADVALAGTQGFRTQRPYAFVGLIGEPLARLAFTGLLLLLGAGVTGALAGLAASSWTAAVLGSIALARRVRALPAARPTYDPRALFGFSMVSWGSSVATTGLIWADTLLLGIFRSDSEVGVYNVSTRLVQLAVFVMLPINAAFSPHIAHLHRVGALDDLRRAYAVTTSWILRLSLPAFVVLLVVPTELLRVFGRDFRAGAAVTVILALGKLVDAATGPCGLMLNMSGRPAVNMADNVAALVLNVVLNLWLIPAHGIVGAAIAWAVSLCVVNAARVLQVRALYGILPFGEGSSKGLVAGCVALLAGVAVRLWVEEWLRLPLVGLTVVGAYVVTLALLGVTDEDRMALRSLGRRLFARA